MKKFVLLLFLLAGMSASSEAQPSAYDYEWYSPKRLVIGLRLERQWYDKEIAVRPVRQEYAAGLSAAWLLVPNVSLTARYLHGIKSQEDALAVGVNLKIFDGWRDLR
jgi:hypothetical protein